MTPGTPNNCRRRQLQPFFGNQYEVAICPHRRQEVRMVPRPHPQSTSTDAGSAWRSTSNSNTPAVIRSGTAFMSTLNPPRPGISNLPGSCWGERLFTVVDAQTGNRPDRRHFPDVRERLRVGSTVPERFRGRLHPRQPALHTSM